MEHGVTNLKISPNRHIDSSDLNQILSRLDRIDAELICIRTEMAETRGAYKLGKWVLGLLGITGISSIAAWLAGNGAGK